MLMRLCNSHPQINLLREFGLFANVGTSLPIYRKYIIKRLSLIRNRRPIDISRSQPKPFWFINNSIFVFRFLRGLDLLQEPNVTATAIDASLRKIFPTTQIVGDKWPAYWRHLSSLTKEKNLDILFIYRDCRDVTSSFLVQARTNWQNETWWQSNKNNAEKIAASWVHMIKKMEAYASDVKMIRYEDLVTAPNEIMSDVGQWLNFESQLFKIDIVKPTSIGKYKNGLTNSELEAVMHVAGPTMARLGYV